MDLRIRRESDGRSGVVTKYDVETAVDGRAALDITWTATQIELRELDISPADAAVFQEIAGQLFYGGGAMGPSLRDTT